MSVLKKVLIAVLAVIVVSTGTVIFAEGLEGDEDVDEGVPMAVNTDVAAINIDPTEAEGEANFVETADENYTYAEADADASADTEAGADVDAGEPVINNEADPISVNETAEETGTDISEEASTVSTSSTTSSAEISPNTGVDDISTTLVGTAIAFVALIAAVVVGKKARR